MRQDELKNSLVRQVVAAETHATARRIQYLLLGIPKLFRKTGGTMRLTPNRMRLLELLSLTMASAQLLTEGGIFKNLRSAQRELRNLKTAGYLSAIRYPLVSTGAFRYFYHPGTPGRYHKIQEPTIEHDSLTALFLIHLWRRCAVKQLGLRWYPPFSLKNKVCDGGIAIFHEQRPVRSLIIETDMATHDFTEISEKLATYLPFLHNFPKRMLVFLVNEASRAAKIVRMAQEATTAHHANQVVVLCPWQLMHLNLWTFCLSPEEIFAEPS